MNFKNISENLKKIWKILKHFWEKFAKQIFENLISSLNNFKYFEKILRTILKMLRKFEKISLKIEKILKKLRQPWTNIRKYSVSSQ